MMSAHHLRLLSVTAALIGLLCGGAACGSSAGRSASTSVASSVPPQPIDVDRDAATDARISQPSHQGEPHHPGQPGHKGARGQPGQRRPRKMLQRG